jgi:hypothetical protein
MNVVEYKVTYTPRNAVPLSDFMAGLDLGIEAITVSEIFELTTKTKADTKYQLKMREVIWEAVEKCGCKVYKVELLKAYKLLG